MDTAIKNICTVFVFIALLAIICVFFLNKYSKPSGWTTISNGNPEKM